METRGPEAAAAASAQLSEQLRVVAPRQQQQQLLVLRLQLGQHVHHVVLLLHLMLDLQARGGERDAGKGVVGGLGVKEVG